MLPEIDILESNEVISSGTNGSDLLNASREKIKVLQTIRQGQIGGGETHVLDLVSGMDRDKFEVEVLSFTDGEMVDRLSDLNVKCHIIHTERAFDFAVWKKVSSLFKERDFDMIHSHGTRAASNTLWSARSQNTPMIYTVHGWSFHPDQGKVVHTLREKSESLLTSKADITINVSNHNKEEGIKLLGLKESLVIPNGVDLTRYNIANIKDINSTRSELNIPSDVPVVGFIARFTKQKSPSSFIKAASEILETFPSTIFLMVGDGELKEEAIQLSESLGIKNSFRFPGFRTDVPELLSIIDIYCLPSLWEGLPIGVLEAMSMRKVVVASSVNGTAEIITDGENGFLFKSNHITQLVEKVCLCLSNPSLMEKISEEARRTIEKKYNKTKMVSRVETLYTQVYDSKKTTFNTINNNIKTKYLRRSSHKK